VNLCHLGWRLKRSAARVLALGAAAALIVPAATPGPSTASASRSASETASTSPPISFWAPRRVVAFGFDGFVFSDLGLRVIAEGAPFELWSNRASYRREIQTVWRSPSGDVPLPSGTMSSFSSGLPRFVKLTVTSGDRVRTLRRPACLGGESERVRPDAPATSRYPQGCFYNPYALGAVQGVQEGWAASILGQSRPLRLPVGRYTVTATIGATYARTFGLAAADASRTFRLIVRNEEEFFDRGRTQQRVAQPARTEPTQSAVGTPAGPVPDLRSLPAWGIGVGEGGNQLQFSATVWNAGDSPLVVDGFRREDEDVMDAYQYFFDADGNQTGAYQQVGEMHWDSKRTHQHWHFEDFARYTLLSADKTEVVRSRKEAFCLANTDAVDLTVPDAAWNPFNTDLSTSCGDSSSLSIREVLASGWGDTYAQFRAGQSFNLRGLPNGKYYVAVIANPENRLVEASKDNNVALRKVFIGGTPGHRTVRVPQVGLVEEEFSFFEE
jgi:hypothetical protein